MALLDVRLRAGYLFLAVVIGHIVLISAQVNARTGVPILETVTFGAFAEVQRAHVGGAQRRARERGAATWRFAPSGRRTKRCAATWRVPQVEIQRQRALADRTRSLEDILQLGNSTELQTDGGADHRRSGESRTSGPSRSTRAPPRACRPTWRCSRPGEWSDGSSCRRHAPRGCSCWSTATRRRAHSIERSRAQGVVVGAGDDRLRLEFVSEISDVAVGDTVVTSGHRRDLSERVRDRTRRHSRQERRGVSHDRHHARPWTSRHSRTCWSS